MKQVLPVWERLPRRAELFVCQCALHVHGVWAISPLEDDDKYKLMIESSVLAIISGLSSLHIRLSKQFPDKEPETVAEMVSDCQMSALMMLVKWFACEDDICLAYARHTAAVSTDIRKSREGLEAVRTDVFLKSDSVSGIGIADETWNRFLREHVFLASSAAFLQTFAMTQENEVDTQLQKVRTAMMGSD